MRDLLVIQGGWTLSKWQTWSDDTIERELFGTVCRRQRERDWMAQHMMFGIVLLGAIACGPRWNTVRPPPLAVGDRRCCCDELP